MNIIINKNAIEQMLINVQNFLDKKDSSQITSHILIDTQNDNITIKATDFEIGLSIVSDNVQIKEPGVTTANGKKLLDVIKILKDGDITLQTEENNLLIKQSRSRFKLPVFNPNEYPEFPSVENRAQFKIEASQFLTLIKKISSAIDTNNPKYELNGALIDINSEYINFVATDTRRLAMCKIDMNNSDEVSLIIPKKAISEIQKLFFDEMKIYYDENSLLIRSQNFEFFTKLINGKFPDYQRIVPNDYRYDLILSKEKMIDHLKQVSTISSEIKLTFSNESITFESLNEDNNEAKTETTFVSNIDEEIVLAVNSRYILDFLAQIEKNEFKLRYNDSTLPFVLESENFITVVMPIMI
jgi:DNA polymerase-3 subunit beta